MLRRRRHNAFFRVTALAVLGLVTGATASVRRRSPSCIPAFDRRFEQCKSKPCVLFKEGPPFVILGSSPPPREFEPFPCMSARTKYNLDGIFIDLLGYIRELDDALCIYTGNKCTYDDLVMVLQDAAEVDNYQFIAGDCLFTMPYRITNASRASVSFLNGKYMVMGKLKNVPHSGTESIRVVANPFQANVWLMILVLFTLMFATRGFIVCIFGSPGGFLHWYWFMLGEYGPEAPLDANEEEQLRHWRLVFWAGMWTRVLLAFVACGVLFFELAVVNVIFQRREPVVSVPPGTWPVSQMKKFAVERASAQEHMVRFAARYSKTEKPPWHSCSNASEVLSKVQDPTSNVDFGVTYSDFSSYILRQEGKCDTIVVFELPVLSRSYEAVWYYGKSIPLQLQESINKRIATLRLIDAISGIVRKHVGTDDRCGGESQRALGLEDLWLPLLLFPVPFFAMFGINLLVTRLRI